MNHLSYIILRLWLAVYRPESYHNASDLSEAVVQTAPRYLTKEAALLHTAAAIEASTPNFSAELLLGLAYVESRYLPGATSRVESGHRKTGIPPWENPPEYVHGPYFCGVTQVMADMSWSKCLQLRDVKLAYKTAAKELTSWLAICKKRKEPDLLSCSLLGYGGGGPAIVLGTSTYPNRVIEMAAWIRSKRHINI